MSRQRPFGAGPSLPGARSEESDDEAGPAAGEAEPARPKPATDLARAGQCSDGAIGAQRGPSDGPGALPMSGSGARRMCRFT